MRGSTLEVCLSLLVTADALDGMAERCGIGRVALVNALVGDGVDHEHHDIRDGPA